MWAEVSLRNVVSGKVVDFVYTDSSWPWIGALPKSGVVQFRTFDEHVVPFIFGFPKNVAITTIQAEWIDNGKTLICRNSGIHYLKNQKGRP